MLRKIIRPKNVNYNIRIPKEYLNQKIEILVIPLRHFPKDNIIDNEVKAFSNHSTGNIDEWREPSDDEIWT